LIFFLFFNKKSGVGGTLKGVGKSIFNVVTLKPLRKDKNKDKDGKKEEKDKKEEKSPRKAESLSSLSTDESSRSSLTTLEKKERRKSMTTPAEPTHKRKSVEMPLSPVAEEPSTAATAVAAAALGDLVEASESTPTKKHRHHTRQKSNASQDGGEPTGAVAAGPTIAIEEAVGDHKTPEKTMKRRKSSSSNPHPESIEHGESKKLVKRKSSSSAPHQVPAAVTVSTDAVAAPAAAFEGEVELSKGGTLGLGKSKTTLFATIAEGSVKFFSGKDKNKLKYEFLVSTVTPKADPTHNTRLDVGTTKKTLHLTFASEQARIQFIDACK